MKIRDYLTEAKMPQKYRDYFKEISDEFFTEYKDFKYTNPTTFMKALERYDYKSLSNLIDGLGLTSITQFVSKYKDEIDRINEAKEERRREVSYKDKKGRNVVIEYEHEDGHVINTDPSQKDDIKCSMCRSGISFSKKQVHYSNVPSWKGYVCKDCSNFKTAAELKLAQKKRVKWTKVSESIDWTKKDYSSPEDKARKAKLEKVVKIKSARAEYARGEYVIELIGNKWPSDSDLIWLADYPGGAPFGGRVSKGGGNTKVVSVHTD